MNITTTHRITRVLALVGVAGLLQACAASGLIKNQPIEKLPTGESRVVEGFRQILSNAERGIMLGFSGGGTRAAALSYGVLQELQDTRVGAAGQRRALLDDVGLISSVSGGSFTAAYYGLYGKDIFKDFESAFLRKDVAAPLVNNILNPWYWFGSLDRTEYAIQYYDKEVFAGATFADMDRDNAPLVLINATDISNGVRFSFMQEYFNLLCSDLSSFPVSRAVTASSAVPILFDPVVLKNYSGCNKGLPRWLKRARQNAADDPELLLTVSGLEGYFNYENQRYSHFVDGGITDNLGLRAIFDMTQLTGDGRAFLHAMKLEPAKRLVVISVDASTRPEYKMGLQGEAPDIFSTINAMTDIQLHRYNTATVAEMTRSLQLWADRISTEETKVDVFFIRLHFDQLPSPSLRSYINEVPTNFNLTNQQVDTVIKAGRDLLRQNPDYQRLLATIRAESDSANAPSTQ